MEPAGRVALVSGESGGIGAAVVRGLAADGFSVGVHFGRNRSSADTAVDDVAAVGGRGLVEGGDMGDEADMARVFDAFGTEFGGIDVVVNTAGICSLPLLPRPSSIFPQLSAVPSSSATAPTLPARLRWKG